jgi:hypothetical protein
MNNKKTTRRKFLVAAITFSAVAASVPGTTWLKSSSAWAESTADPDALLAHMARCLFPHDGMGDNVYAEVMSGVITATAADPSMAAVFQAAETAFNLKRGTPWMSLDEAEQVAVIQELQNEAFFAAVLAKVRAHFYYHPAVWQHLDYPGSSREYGGYIKRGFDDIDWLHKSA